MNTSKAVCEITAPADLPAGSRLWLSASWFNARMQPGPAATPQSTRVGEGLALAA
jgi:hypothetical protein